MKGSPAKLGIIQGTSGHKSALKTAMDDALAKRQAQQDPSPTKGFMDVIGSFAKDKLKDIVKPKEYKEAEENKIVIDDSKSEKIKNKKIKLKGGGTTNTSSRPGDTVVPLPKPEDSEGKGSKKYQLKQAKKKGKAARKKEKFQARLDRALETREERLTRRRKKGERWEHRIDQIFNPEEARKTERLREQWESQEKQARIRGEAHEAHDDFLKGTTKSKVKVKEPSPEVKVAEVVDAKTGYVKTQTEIDAEKKTKAKTKK